MTGVRKWRWEAGGWCKGVLGQSQDSGQGQDGDEGKLQSQVGLPCKR